MKGILKHVPTQLGTEHEDVDLVLAMDASVVASAGGVLPQATVKRLRDFVGDCGDVDDPYGGDQAEYRACARQLEGLIVSLVASLERDAL